MSATATKPAPAVKRAPQAAKQATESIERAGMNVSKVVNRALDRYERNVAHFVEFEHRAAEAVPFDWAKAAINLYATFVEDISAVYVKTTRAALK
jgi:hypothetical protein